MNKRLKVGLIGCGRISQKHFDALTQLNDLAELVAVCDINESAALEAGKKMACESFTSITEFLNQHDYDLVTIATPNGLHYQHAKAAPITLDVVQGFELVNLAKQQQLELFVVYQNRYNDPVIKVKKAITEGRFGQIYLLSSNVYWQRPQEYFDKDASWHGTKDLDGGAFITQASHYVDMVQWLAGSKAKSVYGKLKTLARKIETEDTGSVIIEFASGAIANINVTILTYPKNLEGSVTILGEKGTVKIGGVSLNEIEHFEFSDSKNEDHQTREINIQSASVYGFGHVRQYKEIFAHLNKIPAEIVTGLDGIKSLEILTAIHKSAQTHTEVQL
jgi:UDP-N-acetyl-2-amino-2-deoxyglucuronate dehydrogenase